MAKLKKLLTLCTKTAYLNALLRHRVAAAVEHQKFIRSIDIATLIDVGANVGQFSLMVRALKPDARIVAFEPLSQAAETYRKVFAGDDAVRLHQVAVSPARSKADMHVSKRPDSSSLLPISALQSAYFPGTEEAGREMVDVAPLTDFVGEDDLTGPALLKVDVQGSELDVLQSAGPLMPRFDWIYVETSFVSFYEGQALAHDVTSFLSDKGLRFSGIYNPAYDRAGLVVQADFLFAKTVG